MSCIGAIPAVVFSVETDLFVVYLGDTAVSPGLVCLICIVIHCGEVFWKSGFEFSYC